jgi:hypothetical protein
MNKETIKLALRLLDEKVVARLELTRRRKRP